MKRLSVLLLSALAFFVNACEKHPASELPEPHATMFGKHSAEPHGETHEGGEKATAHEPAAEHKDAPKEDHAAGSKEEAKATAETKPGEAPKFFPEKKEK